MPPPLLQLLFPSPSSAPSCLVKVCLTSARSLLLRRLLPPSLRQIARDTCVSPACVLKYQRLLNGWIADGRCPPPADDTSCCPNFDALLATGGLPKRGGVRAACCKWTPAVDERVRALVTAQPQLFLDEICVALRADTVVADPAAAAVVLADCNSPPVNSPAAASAAVVCVSRSTVCRRLQLAGLRRVVVAHVAPQRSSARVIEERARFVAQVLPTLPAADSGLLLCCDESHVDRKCEHRRYGRAPHGQRPVVLQPHNGGDSARERHTLIRAVGISLRHISPPPRDHAAGRPSAPTLQLVSANRISSGSTNSATFTDFLHHQLGPLAHSMQEQFAKAHADSLRQPDVPHALLHPPSPLELPPAEPPSSPSPAAGASGGADGAGRRRRRPQRAPRRPLAPVQPATAAWITCAPPPPSGGPAGDHGGRVHRRHPAQRRSALRPLTQLRPPPPVVVLLDNWVGHHSRVAQHAVNTYWSNTLRVVFVPPYSPDFNWPIECSFHDIKTQLRRDRLAAPLGATAAALPAAASNAAQDRGRGERGLGVPLPPLTASVLADVVRHSDARRDPFENVTTLLHRARHAGYALENSPWLAAELDRVSPHVF